MKINQSLARFSGVITGLAVSGTLLALIGFIVIATHQGYDFDITAVVNGVSLSYLGSGLVGLAIFGSFLRITATSIIEGMGGNVATATMTVVAQPPISAGLNNPQAAQVDKGPESKLWQQLSARQYNAWIDADQPNLIPWDEAGRPDFLTWLKDQA